VAAGEIPAAPNFFGQSKHFNVTDNDITEVEVRVVKAASVSGFVVIEGPADSDTLARLSEMRIVAMVKPRPGGANPILTANIKVDGSFSFTGLMPGTLQFNFAAPRVGGPLPLRLIRVERDGVRLDHDPEIEAGDQLTGLRVVLGYAISSIHGVVKLNGEALPRDAVGRVIIVQNGVTIDGVSLDSRGEFILQHLAAGDYKLIVSARSGDQPERKIEKTVSLSDNKALELTIDLASVPGLSGSQ
jgi:hypothetical protein